MTKKFTITNPKTQKSAEFEIKVIKAGGYQEFGTHYVELYENGKRFWTNQGLIEVGGDKKYFSKSSIELIPEEVDWLDIAAKVKPNHPTKLTLDESFFGYDKKSEYMGWSSYNEMFEKGYGFTK